MLNYEEIKESQRKKNSNIKVYYKTQKSYAMYRVHQNVAPKIFADFNGTLQLHCKFRYCRNMLSRPHVSRDNTLNID